MLVLLTRNEREDVVHWAVSHNVIILYYLYNKLQNNLFKLVQTGSKPLPTTPVLQIFLHYIFIKVLWGHTRLGECPPIPSAVIPFIAIYIFVLSILFTLHFFFCFITFIFYCNYTTLLYLKIEYYIYLCLAVKPASQRIWQCTIITIPS